MHQTRRATLRARELRRHMTDAEAKLWSRLRNGRLLSTKFRRQVPIGNYIADFCCRNLKLVIEVDGGQHAEHAAQDAARTRMISMHGYTVLRFWDDQVLKDIEDVLEAIAREVTQRKACPLTLPSPTLR
jgi:very-short-patch-repair endonuclease